MELAHKREYGPLGDGVGPRYPLKLCGHVLQAFYVDVILMADKNYVNAKEITYDVWGSDLCGVDHEPEVHASPYHCICITLALI